MAAAPAAGARIDLMQDMAATSATQAAQALQTPEALPAPQAHADIFERVAGWVALTILLITFVTLNPFADLGDPRLLEPSGGGETVTYIAYFLIVGVAGLLLYRLDRVPILPLVTKANLLLLAWLIVSIILSADPATSARRFSLTGATFLLAAMLPWLTSGLRQLAGLLLSVAVLVLLLSYFGVLLMPDMAVHQSTDLAETDLASDWRGIYGHKNITAGVMAVLVYIGWFVARVRSAPAGILIAVAAFPFLVLSGGKTALGMVFVVGIIAFFVARARSIWTRAFFAFGPLVAINILTVGSVTSEAIRSVVAALPVDVTFSGRTEIWVFAFDVIRAHPWKGYGFEAFWYSDAVRLGAEDSTRWMVEVATGHNSYVDLALTIGLPGLMLALLAFVVAPLRDFHHALDAPANREFARLSLVLWLFALYLGIFEAFFLSRANFMWFILAFAVCGLRYSAKFVVRE